MNLTLRQLGYFKALSEQRNFRRAAEACHVSQPALSVQIRELETTLNGPLVERHARDVVLTPFGREVLEVADRILGEAERRGVRRAIAIEARENHAAIELEREKGFAPEAFDGDPTLVVLAKTFR